ncbi:MAG TPA: hypothetical protein VM487_24985 [Phycisphaerae bacterium]|nr:hypothetical protein [Phycisphaerae bacterium]
MSTYAKKGLIQRQIDRTDRQACPDEGRIDRLVYELYGLTKEEIKIVEEATR